MTLREEILQTVSQAVVTYRSEPTAYPVHIQPITAAEATDAILSKFLERLPKEKFPAEVFTAEQLSDPSYSAADFYAGKAVGYNQALKDVKEIMK